MEATIFLVLTGTFERLVLRKREPGPPPRPYKAWGYPWTPAIVIIGSILFLIGGLITDTANSLYSTALIAISYPVYLLTKKFNSGRGT